MRQTQTQTQIFFFLVLVICSASSKRDFVIGVTDIKCKVPSRIMNVTCSVTKRHNWSRSTGFNVFFRAAQDLFKLQFNASVDHFTTNTKPVNIFRLHNQDMCKFLEGKMTVPILLISRMLLRKFSNFPDGCPLKKDESYYIQRMRFDPEHFPPYIPDGRFLITGSLFNEKHVFFDFKTEIKVSYKSKFKLTIKSSDKVEP